MPKVPKCLVFRMYSDSGIVGRPFFGQRMHAEAVAAMREARKSLVNENYECEKQHTEEAFVCRERNPSGEKGFYSKGRIVRLEVRKGSKADCGEPYGEPVTLDTEKLLDEIEEPGPVYSRPKLKSALIRTIPQWRKLSEAQRRDLEEQAIDYVEGEMGWAISTRSRYWE